MTTRPQLLIVDKRPKRRLRFLRAIWRDTWALWREFRTPILAFLMITTIGGFVYGELYYLARGVVIPLIDRPYIMLQLMILETSENAPSEWYLVIFWYLLPPIFIFIVGRGASDFVRLFFNRDERRDAWREAVASTYRNHVIILGVGHVGLRVVRILVSMGVDVVAIDNSPDADADALLGSLNVLCIVADARIPNTLEKAGLRHAEAFVACTGNDHLNLETIMRARDMNPNIRIIARVWNDDFAKQIRQFMKVQTVLSSSGLSAPAFAGAALGVEITQTLRVGNIDYSMIRLDVRAGSFLEGRAVGDLQKENDMDIVLYSDGATAEVQPSRDKVVKAGDTLVIFAQHDCIIDIVARNRAR